MAPSTYGVILGRNIAAARARIGLNQANLAARMQALGFTQWVAQTASKSERNARRTLAEEVLGLAYALDTTVERLMTPQPEDGEIALPNGTPMPWESVRFTVSGGAPDGDEPPDRIARWRSYRRGIQWEGDSLITAPSRWEKEA